jgi:hypothetical protein
VLSFTNTACNIFSFKLVLNLALCFLFSNGIDILSNCISARFKKISAGFSTFPVFDFSLRGIFSPMVVVARSGPGFLPSSSPNFAHFLRCATALLTCSVISFD